jgi:predicted RNase H-like HicB family nuclease
VPFDGLCALLRRLGFAERTRGSHHVFTAEDIEQILQLAASGERSEALPSQADARRHPALESPLGGMTMDSRYEIIIYRSDEDGAFVAEVPELPGCMADGKSCQEALANAEQIIQEWIETAQELGRPAPSSPSPRSTPSSG